MYLRHSTSGHSWRVATTSSKIINHQQSSFSTSNEPTRSTMILTAQSSLPRLLRHSSGRSPTSFRAIYNRVLSTGGPTVLEQSFGNADPKVLFICISLMNKTRLRSIQLHKRSLAPQRETRTRATLHQLRLRRTMQEGPPSFQRKSHQQLRKNRRWLQPCFRLHARQRSAVCSQVTVQDCWPSHSHHGI